MSTTQENLAAEQAAEQAATEIETVTDDTLDITTEDAPRAEHELVMDEMDAHGEPITSRPQPEPEPEPEPQAAPASNGTEVDWLKDGSYRVMGADSFEVSDDGKTVTLTEDAARRLARQRIDHATRKLRETERAAAEREAELRRELEAIRAQGGQPQEAQAQQAEPQKQAADDPEPDFDSGDYDSINEFQKEWYQWRKREDAREDGTQQPAAAQEAAPGEVTIEDVQARVADALEDGARRYTDYEDVVIRNENAPFDVMMANFITQEADDAAGAFYYLGQNTDAAVEIYNALTNNDVKGAIRRLAKAEALAPSGTATDSRGPAPSGSSGVDTAADYPAPSADPSAQISRAPAPVRPISGTAPSVRDPNKESYAEYEQRRRREQAQRA